ncbi:MAG: DNA methyltransferase [Atribacterota bacterium]|nr:DNA methyltransferase [Atribacterota bacterium]
MQNIEDFRLEETTVWSFPERGTWCTHNPNFRGNFAPQVARNVILRYSKEGDTVLDPMMGSGTTLIEAKLLKRKGIGRDINPQMVQIATRNLNFSVDGAYEPILEVGDVRHLVGIENESIDLILTHPPYLNAISYSQDVTGDLSLITSVKEFCQELEKGIREFYRVLKGNAHCAILIGDLRKSQHFVPLSHWILQKFLCNGFILREDIIKVQHNCRSTPRWKRRIEKYNFLMIMHEHLFVFRKPRSNENLKKFRFSMHIEM